MISAAAFGSFLSASVILAAMPGPGMMYVLTRSLAGGRREGIQSSLGTFVGGFAHVVGAALGLSTLLAASAVAYEVVRWAGALYLVYLGIRMLWSASHEGNEGPLAPAAGNPFTQGIVTEALNPKTALFFLSFIPQFVDPKAEAVWQFLLLGTISVFLNTSADVIVAMFAGPIGKKLLASARMRRNQRRATGAMMVGLGIYVAAREA
jgi:threonine/homoserine/homoserine lactone efflux protein